ncbi:MAG: nucleotide exchange factor GrpE [Lachnospiraceae bacterium]|nr:nucleotide exchange factor GrpE [Lachnospiraceae bacterium]
MADKEKDIVEEGLENAEAEEIQQENVKTQGESVASEDAEGEEMEADAVAGEAEENTEGASDPKTWAEKRAAKKAAKQDKKEDAYKEKIEQLEDRVMRQMAEFENFRKRTDKEKQAMFETGAKSVIEKILPVVDNFERGFASVEAEDENDAFVGGMKMVYKQLIQELENIGVKPIEAVGCEFDPNFHNAVMQVASEEYESGVVAQELLKGYTYRDTVVRHTMVAVVE